MPKDIEEQLETIKRGCEELLVEKELKRLRLLQALEDSFGTWSDEDYPDLVTSEDIDAYVRKSRESWMSQIETQSTIVSGANG